MRAVVDGQVAMDVTDDPYINLGPVFESDAGRKRVNSNMGSPTIVCLIALALAGVSGMARSRDVPPQTPVTLNVIPQPVSVRGRPGTFLLPSGTAIVVSPDVPEARQVARYLAHAANAVGLQLDAVGGGKPSARGKAIILALSIQQKTSAIPGGYELEVSERSVRIQAPTPTGLFYGVQTFLQMLPSELASATRAQASWSVPCVEIADYPRFAWRGLMLDVSRHFFSKAFVLRYLDQMAKYKMNVFHWHLTDNNGWRIEIRSLPRLTEVGAWRVPRLGRWGEVEAPRKGEAATEGGYYTQEDIREVIAYARERFITVVPEIEMPGHSMAALAAYPELSCTGGPIYVDPGGAFSEKDVTHNLCPGNDKTFEYVDRVLSEVASLFPSQYVHIGGDECFKGFWKNCAKCRRRMEEEGLRNEEELQSYFVRRVERILASKGKSMVGWDEILEGGLAPNATVMSWRGMQGGIAAAKMNHNVIMAPTDFVYLDYAQGDHSLESGSFGQLLLNTCYRFEPVPDGVDPKRILGGQGNLWTEFVPNSRQAEYMTWPRAFALAEVLWSPNAGRSWDDFTRRVQTHFPRLDAAQVNSARAMYDVTMAPLRDAEGRLAVRMSTELSGCDIYYTFDGTTPDRFMPKYSGEPVTIPADAYVVKAMAYREGRPSSRLLSLTVKELAARVEHE